MTTHDEPTELTKLWEISDNGKAEWWPEQVHYDKSYGWNYTDVHDCLYDLRDDDALYIVKGHAEEWLRGRGWDIFKLADGVFQYRLLDAQARKIVPSCKSLPDALRAEAGREV